MSALPGVREVLYYEPEARGERGVYGRFEDSSISCDKRADRFGCRQLQLRCINYKTTGW